MIIDNTFKLIQITETITNKIKVYDKVKWHFPDGDASSLKCGSLHIQQMFEYLNSNNMLSKIGKQEISLPISEDTILSSDMVNDKGRLFLDKYYDKYLQNIEYCKPSKLVFEIKDESLYKHSKKTGTLMGAAIGATVGGLYGNGSAKFYDEDPLTYALGGAALGGLTGALSGRIQGHFAGKEIHKDPRDKYAGSYGILKSVPLTMPLIAAGTIGIPAYVAKHGNIKIPSTPDGVDPTNFKLAFNNADEQYKNIADFDPETLGKYAAMGLATGAIAAIPTGIYHRYLTHKSAAKKIKTDRDPIFTGHN